MIENFFKFPWLCRALVYKILFKKVGWWSYIGSPLFLKGASKISLGTRVRLFPGSRLEVHGKNASITIGNNVGIGQGFHCTAASNLEIGDGTSIFGNVVVTDIDHEYRQIGRPVLEQPFIVRPTKIGKNCLIGFGACIQGGTILGDGCVVGAGAVVRGVFPPHSVIVGSPGRTVKRLDRESGDWIRV
jgi:acetyltransferase-like isoleucine patch superfamily enzyme